MTTEYFLVDDRSDRQTIEAICKRDVGGWWAASREPTRLLTGEVFPQLDVVAPLRLVVEAVDSIDRGALVVACSSHLTY